MNDYDSHLRPDRGVFPLSELMDRSAADFGSLPVMRAWTGSGYRVLTYRELKDMTQQIARWLINQGIKGEDKVAVLGENRPEWGASYLGVQAAGAVVIPVDSLMPPPGIRHILADSGAKILFASSKFLRLLAELEEVKTLDTLVCFDEDCLEDAVRFSTVLKEGANSKVEMPKRKLDELAAILYTSGTTGYSKGVMLTARNIMSNVASASRIFPIGTDDTFLSVLPIHHSFECTAGFLLPIYCGCSITYAHSMKSNDLIAAIKDTRVTIMVGVPLLYEKMHAGLVRGIKKKGKIVKILFNSLNNTVIAGEKAGLELGTKLFKSTREKAGFGTVKFFISGGGPLDPATALFFNRFGIRLMQGYGLTETSPVTHVNPPWKVRHETVGPAIPAVECKIIDLNPQGIGEICLRGPNIFVGYYNNPEATAEVMDQDGWFYTGDLGVIHPDGYLQIRGRKKNMLVTGGGKNVYPEEIEHYLNHSLYIAESLIIGVPRESGYGEEVMALIYPDYEQVDLYFEQKGHKASPEDVYNLIKGEIKEAMSNLAEYKHVRTFKLVDEEFQKTSTRKIKRFLYTGDVQKVNGEGKN
ncbi:MAG: AMP-dependent synthetase/ligase [Calditrichota bacterium]